MENQTELMWKIIKKQNVLFELMGRLSAAYTVCQTYESLSLQVEIILEQVDELLEDGYQDI